MFRANRSRYDSRVVEETDQVPRCVFFFFFVFVVVTASWNVNCLDIFDGSGGEELTLVDDDRLRPRLDVHRFERAKPFFERRLLRGLPAVTCQQRTEELIESYDPMLLVTLPQQLLP